MPLSDKFKQKAALTFTVYENVKDAVDSESYAEALSNLQLSAENKSVIANHFSIDANGDRFDQTNYNKDKTFEQNAAHGFMDATKKSIGFLQNIERVSYEDDVKLLTETVQNYNILKNVVHNTRKLKLDQDETNIAIQIMLIERGILPTFDKIIKELEQLTGLNRNDISDKVTDIEHLQRLPENVFEQHIEV